MPNPRVSVDLDIDSKLAEKTIAEIKKKLKEAFSSFEGFKGFTFSMSEVVQGAKAIETAFANMSSSVETKFKSAFKNLPRAIESVAYQVADRLQTAWIKLPIVAEKVAYQVVDKLQTIWVHRIPLAAKAIYTVADKIQTAFIKIVNFQFRPGAILDGIQKIYQGFSSLISKTGSLKSALASIGKGVGTGALFGVNKLSSAFMGLPGLISKGISAVTNFVFSLKGLAAAAATGALGVGIFKTAAIAEDVERAQWKFNVLFSDIKTQANATAKEIADTFKVNVGSIQSQMARAADVVQPLGLANKTILEMTRNIALLSQGAEAWTEGRYDAERASTALMKALTGEKEMLKEFGVVITDQEVWDAVRKSGKELSRANFAIAIYNKILERTPKLQEAAFGRIQEFTGRLSQFKESFKTVSAAIGNFTKPIVTAFLNLGATIQRKASEILGVSGFQAWKDLSFDIADRINTIAEKIEGIDLTKLTEDFNKVKESLKALGKGVLEAFGNAFLKIAKALKDTLADAITWGFKSGFSVLKELVPNAAKAIATDIGNALANPSKFIFEKGIQGKLTETEKYFAKITTPTDLGNPFANIAYDFGQDLKDALDAAIKPLKDLGGERKATPKSKGFSGEMEMGGADVVADPKDLLKLKRLDDALRGLGWDRKQLEDKLQKAENPTTAQMQGLSAMYTDMLTRAAGGKRGTKESVEALQHKIEEISTKEQRASEQRNILLEEISKKLNKTPQQIVSLAYS